jgi:hypothetical protein
MVDKDCIFVLGAQDPEMREIAHVLRTLRRGYEHAAKKRMRRRQARPWRAGDGGGIAAKRA